MKLVNLFQAIRFIHWRFLAITYHYCPVCDAKRVVIQLQDNPIFVRCLSCQATAVTMSLVAVLNQLSPDLSSKDVYELSARGPLKKYLEEKSSTLTCSEFLDGVTPGKFLNGVQCQDVQKLTYPDNSFDICTSTEVFEHVPDDLAGFREIKRVLKPGGLFVFTVPIFPSPVTVERARIDKNNEVEFIHPAQYHMDPIRGHDRILVFRDYGKDIVQRLSQQSFSEVRIVPPSSSLPFGFGRTVIVARS